MTDDTVTSVDMDDLSKFEDAFFNKAAKPQEDPVKDEVKEVEEIEDDPLATDEDTDAPVDEAEDEPEDEEEDEPEDEPEPDQKPKKKSFQERINELTNARRESERREAALLKRLEELEKPREVKKEDGPRPLREVLSDDAPSPDALDKDGEAIYPLGEFDPKYIRDLTRFTIAEERKAERAENEQTEQQRVVEAAQEELKAAWIDKVSEAEKEIPDLREALGEMGEVFHDIDSAYGDYLAATIMSCDAGPQMMYYLSQNIGEAQKIVASGPAAATLALGRLEARLTKTAAEEKRNPRQVSKAPLPPETRTRGAGAKFSTRADTDDLDAFEREFFKKK